jgi:hypothetical protein
LARKAGRGVGVQSVRSSLVRFKKLGFSTHKATQHGLVVTIINYNQYQTRKKATQHTTQHTPNTHPTTNNNDNNVTIYKTYVQKIAPLASRCRKTPSLNNIDFWLKEHSAVDTENGFILSTNLTPASHHDSKYLPLAVVSSMHTPDKIQTAYADKGYAGAPNRDFLALNKIKDGIMRKDNINAKLTEIEIQRNKTISKFRYIVEQYFGISHLHDNGDRARFTQIMKNQIDLMFRQFAFNLKKGTKILEVLPG